MLKFHQLEVLIAIVDAGGLRAAARALHLSQAAVVKSLKALEEAAGVPLLVRQSRGVDLTAAGKSLLVRAQAMSRQMRLAEEELLAAQGKLGGTVRVALTPFVALTCLGAAYEWFRHRFPSVQVHFAEGLVHRSIPRLRAGSLDFAVVAATQPLPS
ncbi:MAG TPA: LysR family transcriptional regulator, partial [Ramlibacter sp.]